jgi:UDP-N-acetylmuramate--alanine ligase
MINTEDIEYIYFVGVGGIGMSAIARYFNMNGKHVAGYDRVSTPLTDALTREGISIHFTDDISAIPKDFLISGSLLVVYTPAIPESHSELRYFRQNGIPMLKRSELLGIISKDKTGIAVAGTHGKTSVSTMLAEILNHSDEPANAFLGGISKNLGSNLLLNKKSQRFILEADEFDRSFLQLYPRFALITSMDADHLDIYKDFSSLRKTFEEFIGQVQKGGKLILKKGLKIESAPAGVEKFSYDLEDSNADFYARDIKRKGFNYSFSLVTPDKVIENLSLGVYGKVNLENAVAALSLAWILGEDEEVLRKGIAEFRGVKRRFDVQFESEEHIYIDDYAHHPEEIKAFLGSVREALPDKELTGIFQPHLYSRTRDFAERFGKSLSLLDHAIILEIYPAREKAIPGVSEKMIYDALKNKGDKIIAKKEQVLKIIEERKPEVLLSMGAGDIDQLVEGLTGIMKK